MPSGVVLNNSSIVNKKKVYEVYLLVFKGEVRNIIKKTSYVALDPSVAQRKIVL